MGAGEDNGGREQESNTDEPLDEDVVTMEILPVISSRPVTDNHTHEDQEQNRETLQREEQTQHVQISEEQIHRCQEELLRELRQAREEIGRLERMNQDQAQCIHESMSQIRGLLQSLRQEGELLCQANESQRQADHQILERILDQIQQINSAQQVPIATPVTPISMNIVLRNGNSDPQMLFNGHVCSSTEPDDSEIDPPMVEAQILVAEAMNTGATE